MPITTPGTYELTIKEGAFFYGNEQETGESVTISNITNIEAISATYTVVEAAPAIAYSLDPEDGAIVNNLQTITISFEDKTVQPNDRMEFNAIVLTDEKGEEYYCDAPVRDSRAPQGVVYQLNFLTTVESEGGMDTDFAPITEPGKYKLSIQKGTFISGKEVESEEGVTLEDIVPVEAIYATYTVASATPTAAFTLDPEDGAIVNNLQTITISFENKTAQLNDRKAFNAVVHTVENGDEHSCDAPVRDSRAPQGVAYQLNFLTTVESENGMDSEFIPITKPGTYTLSILKGTFITGDEVETEDGVSLENIVPVEAINASYTVVEAAPSVAFTLNPAEGESVSDLQTITISFENKTVQPNERMEFNAIVLVAENGEEYYCDAPLRDSRAPQGVAYQLNFLTTVETENGMESELKPITEPGTYKLSILQGTFIYGEEGEDEYGNTVLTNVAPVEAINATYIIASTSVNTIFNADTTEFNVYGVNGMQILKSADSNAVDALPSGMYIINGKKVIKK